MRKLTIGLDDAHGSDVLGKGSPDGRHREWIWSMRWTGVLKHQLELMGFPVVVIAPEDTEPGLLTRRERMNKVAGPAFMFSLHNNAAGMGDKWMNAHGFSVWTTKGLTKSDKCADIIFEKLRKHLPDIPYRHDTSDGDHDYEANFTVLTSRHPSVLLEYLFQDNQADLLLIENDALCMKMIQALVEAFVEIEKYLVP